MNSDTLLEFDFGQVTVFDNHIIVVMNEDSIVQKDLVSVLNDIASTYFVDKPFVYVANRINNYTVDPLVYKETSKIKNLVGFAVVSTSPNANVQTNIESQFYDKEFKQFDYLNQAIKWAQDYTDSINIKSKYPTLSDDKPILIEIELCKISVYKSYSVVSIGEGFTVKQGDEGIFKKLINIYYGKHPFVYISHRINSYSVDPIIYKEVSKIENLLGFAVVNEKSKMHSSAEVEKLFYEKAFEMFDNLEAAKKWALKIHHDGFTPNLC